MSLFHLKLRAVNRQRNVDRDYDIMVMRVLLGYWGVTVAFGRHGSRGCLKNYSFATQEEARSFVHKILQRRLRAPKRLGCCYHIVSRAPSQEDGFLVWLIPEQHKQFKEEGG